MAPNPTLNDVYEKLGSIDGKLDGIQRTLDSHEQRIGEKLDKGTFWKVFGAAQAALLAALGFIIREVTDYRY